MTATPGPLFALALASISLIGPLAVHLFLPVIPAVKAALGLTEATAQLTFSIALFGMAFATLFYGSLSDRYGRRLALFLIGSAVSAAAGSIVPLVLGRFLQAVGAGCGITLGRAIAQDVYGGDRLVKALAYLTMFYTIGPMISPIVGGVLIDTFGWRSVFGFALVLGAIIALGAYIAVFETRPPSPENRVRGNVLRNYAELFRHLRFTAFVLQSGFMTSTFLVAATAASSLLKDMLHRPSTEFGFYFLLFPFGFLTGNFITSRIGNRVANETMVLAGSLLSLAAVTTQSSLLLAGLVTPLTLFAPGFFITMAQGLSLSYAQSGAMETNPKLAGTAAGVGVFVQNLSAAVFAQLYGIIADGTVVPLIETTAVTVLCGLVAGVLPFVMARRVRPA
jgi:DHA1 family bicyclomycin/chloramphenicol resistance-like MFS transporter